MVRFQGAFLNQFRSLSTSRRRRKAVLPAPNAIDILETRALLAAQVLTSDGPAGSASAGQTVDIPIIYQTRNDAGANEALASNLFDLNVHFDADQLSFVGVTNVFTQDIVIEPTSTTAEADAAITGNDNDPDTETVLRARYVDSNSDGWPDNPLSSGLTLFVARFTARPGFTGTTINFSANETGTGFDFESASYELQTAGRTLTIADAADVTEGEDSVFVVSLSEASDSVVTVNYSTQDGQGPPGAISGEDFVAQQNQTLTFNPGETQQTITVDTIDDSQIESEEIFNVVLSNPVGASASTFPATGTILDNDTGLPTVTIGQGSTVTEGQTTQFTVSLSRAATSTVTVLYSTRDGNGPTGGTNGADYQQLTNQTLTFAPGQTTRTINVNTIDDSVGEPQENLVVELSNPNGATIPGNGAVGTALIDDNDSDLPTVSAIDSAAIAEGGVVTFTVTLSAASDTVVTVDFSTVDGNGPTGAVAGSDYTARSNQSLSFPVGTTTQTITVDTINDANAESTETFQILLSNAIGARIANSEATGTILDNDDQNGPAGDIDGSGTFDANDAFLIHLVNLSGSNTAIDQFKGASPLTAAQIRTNIDALETPGDVDEVGGFDANDSFLIQLVQLAGTDTAIDQFKGASQLSAAQIRTNVEALGASSGSSNGSLRGLRSNSVDSGLNFSDGDDSREKMFQSGDGETTLQGTTGEDSSSIPNDDFWNSSRDWLDMLVMR